MAAAPVAVTENSGMDTPVGRSQSTPLGGTWRQVPDRAVAVGDPAARFLFEVFP